MALYYVIVDDRDSSFMALKEASWGGSVEVDGKKYEREWVKELSKAEFISDFEVAKDHANRIGCEVHSVEINIGEKVYE